MNITCDANTNVDCVFFKLNGTTDLRKGSYNGILIIILKLTIITEKFDSVLSPAQSLNTNNYCIISTTQPLPTNSTSLKNAMITMTDSGNSVVSDSILKYILIGITGLGVIFVVILMILLFILCLVCTSSKKTKQTSNPKLTGLYLTGNNSIVESSLITMLLCCRSK